MAAFPEDIYPIDGYQQTEEFKTIKSDGYANGLTYTRQARSSNLFSISLRYQAQPIANYNSLMDFFESMKGMDGQFTFFDFVGWSSSPVGRYWPRLRVGVHDGSTTTWDLPIKSSSSRTLYVNNVAKTSGVDYTFSAGTGLDGRDRVTGLSGTNGHIIEFTATGRRAMNASLGDDKLVIVNTDPSLAELALTIIERRTS